MLSIFIHWSPSWSLINPIPSKIFIVLSGRYDSKTPTNYMHAEGFYITADVNHKSSSLIYPFHYPPSIQYLACFQIESFSQHVWHTFPFLIISSISFIHPADSYFVLLPFAILGRYSEVDADIRGRRNGEQQHIPINCLHREWNHGCLLTGLTSCDSLQSCWFESSYEWLVNDLSSVSDKKSLH